MPDIDHLIIHCSDSEFGSAALIRRWHTDPNAQGGRGWRDIGYQFVILNGQLAPGLYLPALDGSIEQGRMIDGDGNLSGGEIGAHALGYNGRSIGICLIGVKNFTPKQMGAWLVLAKDLCHQYKIPPSNIIGHYETPRANGKTCPNMDMEAFRRLIGAA